LTAQEIGETLVSFISWKYDYCGSANFRASPWWARAWRKRSFRNIKTVFQQGFTFAQQTEIQVRINIAHMYTPQYSLRDSKEAIFSVSRMSAEYV
jgi:hypothetical protein